MMAIKYQDLHPTNSSFTFNKREYEMRAFDLAAQVWSYNEFATKENPNGTEVLSELVRDMNNFEPVLKVAWHLLKRKRDFGFYNEFVAAIEKGDDDGDKYKVMGRIYNCFVKTLGVSQPQMDQIKEDLELKKQRAAAD